MRDPGFAKLVILVNGAVPLGMLIWDTSQHNLGPDPVTSILHTTGMMALIFLLLSLCVTPLRKLTGWNWFSHFRRMLGLYAFFYASIHFLTYFYLERDLSFSGLWQDAITGKGFIRFIFYGLTAFCLLIPLALTSTNGAIRALGAANWKRLHRLVYPASIAAVTHFWQTGKRAPPLARTFAIVLTILLGYRLTAFLRSAIKRWLPVTAVSR